MLLALTFGGAFVPLPADAATLKVNSLADPGTGGCDAVECTLREAIATAQAGDTITFAARLFRSGPGTIILTSGELVIDKDLTIAGPGAHRLAISGNHSSRVFFIHVTQTITVRVTLRNLTITDGDGGGIGNSYGTLMLRNSVISGNTSTTGTGGGLFNQSGVVTLTHSLVHNNSSGSNGGGLANVSGTLRLTNSTVSGNMAPNGGGIFNQNGPLWLQNSTVSNNTTDNAPPGHLGFGHGGGVYNYTESTTQFINSIIAGNTATNSGPDCENLDTLTSQGHNLVGADTGCPSNNRMGDRTVDPMAVFAQVLAPLQDNGVPTCTHALLSGSPAIDAGDNARCPATDQRGVARPQGSDCDIGAYEFP